MDPVGAGAPGTVRCGTAPSEPSGRRGAEDGAITPAAGHNFLPSSLPRWLLEILQRQQQAPTANCSEIASLHFRVLLAFAFGAGK